ncbi:MAG: anti-sigma factor [Kofleriaceae bacterium]|nr:anti-sigma factor [Kofleriaceae bacterium]
MIASGLFLSALAACNDGYSAETPLDAGDETPVDAGDETPGVLKLSYRLDNLPDLGADFVYEGWLIVDGQPMTTGRFSADSEGLLSPSYFDVDETLVSAAAKFILTIEPATGDEPQPSQVHIVAGPVADGMAYLKTSDTAAVGTDFAEATGRFVLNTPTTSGDTSDNNQGIWFLVPPLPPAPGLELPELASGWMYEGWVVGPNGPISTGRFTAVDAADLDGAGPTAGPDGSPPRPGQDFIDPAIVLDETFKAVITVEPYPDTSPAPFSIKPLVATIENIAFPMSQAMTNVAAASLPEGVVVFEKKTQ